MKQFIRDRSKRIMLPLLMFWPIYIGLIIAAFAWAVYVQNGAEFPTEPPSNAPSAPDFPLTHLWFLYILVWLYVMAVSLRSLIAVMDKKQVLRSKVDALISTLMQSYVGPLCIAAPIAISLFTISEWIWWGGVPSPHQSLVPVWSSLVIYFYVFSLGWL